MPWLEIFRLFKWPQRLPMHQDRLIGVLLWASTAAERQPERFHHKRAEADLQNMRSSAKLIAFEDLAETIWRADRAELKDY
jgi:hypothetical protein